MRLRIFTTLILLTVLVVPASGQVQTKTQLRADINRELASGKSPPISAANLRTVLNALVNSLSEAPQSWNTIPANTPIPLGRVVEHSGVYYGAIVAHNRAATGPDADATNWILLSNWRGAWSAGAYAPGSFVSHGAEAWVATQLVTSSDPAPNADANTKWFHLGSGGGGGGEQRVLVDVPASDSTVDKIIVEDSQLYTTRDVIVHEATEQQVTAWVNQRFDLGYFSDESALDANFYTVGRYYYNFAEYTPRVVRYISGSSGPKHWVDANAADLVTEITGDVGHYVSDEEAAPYIQAVGNVYYNERQRRYRRATAVTPGQGPVMAKQRLRQANADDVARIDHDTGLYSQLLRVSPDYLDKDDPADVYEFALVTVPGFYPTATRVQLRFLVGTEAEGTFYPYDPNQTTPHRLTLRLTEEQKTRARGLIPGARISAFASLFDASGALSLPDGGPITPLSVSFAVTQGPRIGNRLMADDIADLQRRASDLRVVAPPGWEIAVGSGVGIALSPSLVADVSTLTFTATADIPSNATAGDDYILYMAVPTGSNLSDYRVDLDGFAQYPGFNFGEVAAVGSNTVFSYLFTVGDGSGGFASGTAPGATLTLEHHGTTPHTAFSGELEGRALAQVTGGAPLFSPTKTNLYSAVKQIFHPATNAGVTADDANSQLDVAGGGGETNLLIDNPASPIAASADNLDKILNRAGRLYRNTPVHYTDPTATYRDFAATDLPAGYTWGGAVQVSPAPSSVPDNRVIYTIPGGEFERKITTGGVAFWVIYDQPNWRGPAADNSDADRKVRAAGDVVFFGGKVQVAATYTARTPDRFEWRPIDALWADAENTDTVPTAKLGSGSASSTTFLRGDGSWQTPPTGGSPTLTTAQQIGLINFNPSPPTFQYETAADLTGETFQLRVDFPELLTGDVWYDRRLQGQVLSGGTRTKWTNSTAAISFPVPDSAALRTNMLQAFAGNGVVLELRFYDALTSGNLLGILHVYMGGTHALNPAPVATKALYDGIATKHRDRMYFWPDHQADGKTVPGGVAVGGNIIGRNNNITEAQVAQLLARSPTAIYTIPDAGAITWDVDSGHLASITLGGAPRNFQQLVNATVGDELILRVLQDATGGRTIAWHSSFDLPTGFALNSNANAATYLRLNVIAFDTVIVSYLQPGVSTGGGGGTDQTARNAAAAAQATANAALPKAGGAVTGPLTLSGAPTADLHASTKKYVDDSVIDRFSTTGGGTGLRLGRASGSGNVDIPLNRIVTDANILNAAQASRATGDRGKLLAVSGTNQNELALITAPTGTPAANSITAAQARANTAAHRREWQSRLGIPDDWSEITNGTAIALGKIVEHGGAYFGAITAHSKGATGPDGDPTNWTLLSNWRGDWSAVFYPAGSLVRRAGLPWVATSGVTNSDPAPDASTNTKWLRLGAPAASETVAGIVEAATTAEMNAGTANRFPDAAKVKAYVDANSGGSSAGTAPRQITISSGTYPLTDSENIIYVEVTNGANRFYPLTILRSRLTSTAQQFFIDSRNPQTGNAATDALDRLLGVNASISGNNLTINTTGFSTTSALSSVWGLVSGARGPPGEKGDPGDAGTAASETVAGVVELATTAEMNAGTANKIPDAAKVKAYVDSQTSTGRPLTLAQQTGLTHANITPNIIQYNGAADLASKIRSSFLVSINDRAEITSNVWLNAILSTNARSLAQHARAALAASTNDVTINASSIAQSAANSAAADIIGGGQLRVDLVWYSAASGGAPVARQRYVIPVIPQGASLGWTQVFNGNVTISTLRSWSAEQTTTASLSGRTDIMVVWQYDSSFGMSNLSFSFPGSVWEGTSDVGSGGVQTSDEVFSDDHGANTFVIGRGSGNNKFRVSATGSGSSPMPLRIYVR